MPDGYQTILLGKKVTFKLKRKLFLDEHGNEWEHRES